MDTNTKIKHIAKNIGKAGLLVVAPPIGLTTHYKGWENKAMSASVGILISMASNMGYNFFQTEKIYDSPLIQTAPLSSPAQLLPVIITPFAQYFSPIETALTEQDPYLSEGNRTFVVRGDDVIQFDKETGRYALNFDTNRIFRTAEGKLVSLTESQARLDNLAREQQELVARGDILDAKELTVKTGTAKSYHVEVAEQYTETKSAYGLAVAKMNSDLEQLSEQTGERK